MFSLYQRQENCTGVARGVVGVVGVRRVLSFTFTIAFIFAFALMLPLSGGASDGFSSLRAFGVRHAHAATEKKTDGDGKALYKKAVGKVKQGRYVSAIEDLKKAIKSDEQNPDLWSLYGFAARKAGSYILAERAYARALMLDPNHLGALEYSGELYVETKRMKEAGKQLERLKVLCPQGCRERTLLEQAIQGVSNDATHKW